MWAAVWLVLAELLFKFSFLLCGEHEGVGTWVLAHVFAVSCFLRRNLFVWTDGVLELCLKGIVLALWLFKRVSFALRTRVVFF